MSFFRKLIFLFAILLFIHNLKAQQFTEPIKVGIYNNYPKIFQNEKGKASGVFPEILKKIAQQENWQLEFEFSSGDDCLRKLKNDKLDIMVDVAISAERVQ